MPELRRLGFVVNPHAGHRKADAWKAEISGTLQGSGIDFEIVETPGPEAVEAHVQALSDRSDAVIAVGGDGTAHHVAQRLAGTSGTFGLLPNGSGNDYGRMIGMPRGVRSGLDMIIRSAKIERYNAMQLVIREQDKQQDLKRWSINTAGFGFDAATSEMKSRIPALKGIALYLASSLVTLLTYKSSTYTINGDQAGSFKGLMVAAGIGEFEGGGFRIFPGASVTGSGFRVCEVHESSTLRALPLLLKAVGGGHVGSPKIRMDTTDRVTIASDTPIPIHADGEVVSMKAREVEIRLVPGALNVLLPG